MIKFAIRSMGVALILGSMLASASLAAAQEAPPPTAPPMATKMPGPEAAVPGEKKFTLVSEQIGETKFWFPSTIVVEQGDKVTLDLKNEIPGTSVTHGFALPEYHISEVITRGDRPKVVHFTADKPGVYPYFCQLHPAHVGGQVVVEPASK